MLLFSEPFIFCSTGNTTNIVEYKTGKLIDTISIGVNTGDIVAISIHPNGDIIACADDRKCIRFLSLSVANGILIWKCLEESLSVPKAITALYWDPCFTKNSALYVTDKFGEVFKFPFSTTTLSFIDTETPPTPILGHIGTITSILIDENWIYTADREEKIKQSCKKSPFVIQHYLLGHREYISSMSFICNQKYIVSVGGDDYIFVWNVNTGQCVVKESIALILSATNINASQVITYDEYVLILLENPPWLLLWKWDESEMLLSFSKILTLQVQDESFPLFTTFDSRGNIWILTSSATLCTVGPLGNLLNSIVLPNTGKIYHRNVSKWKKSRKFDIYSDGESEKSKN